MIELDEMFVGLYEKYPEMKKEWDNDAQFKEDRKQYYLSRGLNENVAIQKSWDDFWNMAKERDGIEFSVNRIK